MNVDVRAVWDVAGRHFAEWFLSAAVLANFIYLRATTQLSFLKVAPAQSMLLRGFRRKVSGIKDKRTREADFEKRIRLPWVASALASLLRESRAGLDFADLKNVTLLVCRNLEQALVSVHAPLGHRMPPQVLLACPSQLEQLRVHREKLLERFGGVDVLVLGILVRWRLFVLRAIDSIPEDIGISRLLAQLLGRLLQCVVEKFPIIRFGNYQMLNCLGDRPSIRSRPKIELRMGQGRDLVG